MGRVLEAVQNVCTAEQPKGSPAQAVWGIRYIRALAQSPARGKCRKCPHVVAGMVDLGYARKTERKWNIDPFKEYTGKSHTIK